MKTAVGVLKLAMEKVNKRTGMNISFEHGNTLTVVNRITELRSKGTGVYPAIILFTEGLVEMQHKYYLELKIPKIAICTMTKINATEAQRLEVTFKEIIYPIFESLQKELRRLHNGYKLVLNRTDIPYFNDGDKNTFNQLVDGCIIKNLNIKVSYDACKIN